MNYGETLVYWFLRLNGFFPLNNFVLHLPEQHPIEGMERDQKGTADADILAIRLPHVYEAIGGQEEDWSEKFKDWGFSLSNETIALIVEVKTGQLTAQEIKENAQRAFGDNRIYTAIRRTGIFDEKEADGILKELREQKGFLSPDQTKHIGKLFVSRRAVVGRGKVDVSSILDRYAFYLTLSECERFIKNRMKNEKYWQRKSSDRMFFPDDLIQYFAWKAGVKQTS